MRGEFGVYLYIFYFIFILNSPTARKFKKMVVTVSCLTMPDRPTVA